MANIKRCDVCGATYDHIYPDAKCDGRTILIRWDGVKGGYPIDLCRGCNDYFGFQQPVNQGHPRNDLLRLLRRLLDEGALA